MKIELSEEQVKNLQALIADANIKGSNALVIVGLQQALSKPVEEKEVKVKDD